MDDDDDIPLGVDAYFVVVEVDADTNSVASVVEELHAVGVEAEMDKDVDADDSCSCSRDGLSEVVADSSKARLCSLRD